MGIEEKIRYIELRVKTLGTVSIYTGELNQTEWDTLSEIWDLKKEHFGYTRFSIKALTPITQ